MKDISTVRYQPQRLWEWATLAAKWPTSSLIEETMSRESPYGP